MVTCILCIARNEEQFLDEWINYHLNLGFNHIFILDNNDINNKLVYNNNNVTIIPLYNINVFNNQPKCYNYGLEYIKLLKYDYVGIIDCDEFITFRNYNNINDFIQYEMINKNQNIAEIIWETYDDNDIIYEKYCKTNVIETYTRKQTKLKEYDWRNNEASWSKSICKVYERLYYNETSQNSHWPARSCFDSGFYKTNHIDPNIAVIRHYRTKCMETFIKHKVKYCNWNYYSDKNNLSLKDSYFIFNDRTPIKEKAFDELLNKYIYNE